MAKTPYQPPEQSALGQVVDSLFILALVVASLFVPFYFGMAGVGKTALTFAEKSWAGMNQTPMMQAVWEKLGYTPDSAADVIAARFDYTFSIGALALTALVVIAYFGFIVRYSDREFRDVIAERFDSK